MNTDLIEQNVHRLLGAMTGAVAVPPGGKGQAEPCDVVVGRDLGRVDDGLPGYADWSS